MLRRFRNKISMYETVLSIIDDFQQSWFVLPAFQGIRDEFEGKIALLQELDYSQRFVAQDSGQPKRDKRKYAAEVANKVRAAIMAYATTAEDPELHNSVSFAPSRLRYGSLLETTAHINLVIEKAEAFLTELAPYGVDQQLLDDLIDARDAVLEVKSQPREKIVTRKGVTKMINQTIKSADTLLRDQIDQLVVSLQDAAPQFHMQ